LTKYQQIRKAVKEEAK